ncbi:MAG: hypothetical protein AAGB34_06570 [Planctomycetota bacterium]
MVARPGDDRPHRELVVGAVVPSLGGWRDQIRLAFARDLVRRTLAPEEAVASFRACMGRVELDFLL